MLYWEKSNLKEVTSSVLSSNSTSLERNFWEVEVYDAAETVGNIGILTTEGGEYATYLVKDATGTLIWDSGNPTMNNERAKGRTKRECTTPKKSSLILL